MKKIIYISFLLFLGCKGKEETEVVLTGIDATDSVLIQSQKIHDSANIVIKRMDKKTDDKIESVTNKVYSLQKENSALKESLKTKTIIIRDTVYVRERKNFWGKTKVKVDSSQSVLIDSSENN